MNRKIKRTQKETTTMEQLQQARVKLDQVKVDLEKNLKRQNEIREIQAKRAGRESDIVIRAEDLLRSGKTSDLQAQSSQKEELEKLRDAEKVLRQAGRIQSVRVEELILAVSREKKQELRPAFLECQKRKITAIKLLQFTRCYTEEQQLRKIFDENGLRDILPNIGWPGINPQNFGHQKEHVVSSMKASGFDENEIKHILNF